MQMIFHQSPDCTIYQGNALEVLDTLPEGSVDCVITSPPYLGLRKYSGPQDLIWGGLPDCEHVWGQSNERSLGVGISKSPTLVGFTSENIKLRQERGISSQGQFCQKCHAWRGAYGLEPNIETYIEHTITVLRAIRRVMAKHAVCFWNLGDSYNGSGHKDIQVNSPKQMTNRGGISQTGTNEPSLKPLDMCLIPERVAIAAQADGWYVRSMIIWHKPNPMPESMSGWFFTRHRVKVANCQIPSGNLDKGKSHGIAWNDIAKDGLIAQWQDCPGCPKCTPNDGLVLRKGSWRPTSSYEHVIFMAKDKDYFADGEGVRQPQQTSSLLRATRGWEGNTNRDYPKGPQSHIDKYFNKSYEEAMSLPGRNCRDVWTINTQPFKGAHFATFPEEIPRRCILAGTSDGGYCSKCGEPFARVIEKYGSNYEERKSKGIGGPYNLKPEEYQTCGTSETKTIGFRPTCICNAPSRPGVILDPFCGSGTSGMVARQLGRHSIMIELSEDYCRMAKQRLASVPLNMGI